MKYNIISNNKIINTIVADESFCQIYCAANGYSYERFLESQPTTEKPHPTKEEQLRADVDYIALMTGVEL